MALKDWKSIKRFRQESHMPMMGWRKTKPFTDVIKIYPPSIKGNMYYGTRYEDYNKWIVVTLWEGGKGYKTKPAALAFAKAYMRKH